MAQDLWELMSPQLGRYPGLPNGVPPRYYILPEGFVYQGVSAWLESSRPEMPAAGIMHGD